MDEDLYRARALLEKGTYTCVLCRGKLTRKCTSRGIRPLLELLDEGKWENFSAADKVVGKATAFLYVLLGVRAVYTPVISKAALNILNEYHIEVQFAEIVPAIFNRRRTGYCPMETAVRNISEPTEALAAIRETFSKMQAEKQP